MYWTRSIKGTRCSQCWSMALANDFHHKYLICMSGGRVETRNWANMLGQWVSELAKQSQKTKLQNLIKTAGTAWLSISHLSETKNNVCAVSQICKSLRWCSFIFHQHTKFYKVTYEKLHSIIHTSKYDQFLQMEQRVSRVRVLIPPLRRGVNVRLDCKCRE